jgi:hypothetical protein
MENPNTEIHIEIRHRFNIFELLNKYAFNDGEDVLPEERLFIQAACKKFAIQLGTVAGRWKPVVFETSHSPYYVMFQDCTAAEEKYYRYDDLSVQERRYMDAVIEQRFNGRFIITVDEK